MRIVIETFDQRDEERRFKNKKTMTKTFREQSKRDMGQLFIQCDKY